MKRWRLACHIHSQWSYDADWPLHKLARLAEQWGVDALMMTEHDRGYDAARFGELAQACQAASTAQVRVVPGMEYSDPDNCIHILTWGVDHFLGQDRPTLETLHAVREAGGAAVFAHPARRSAWQRFDPQWAELLVGIELWNRKTDGVAPGVEARRLLSKYPTLLPFYGLDFHRNRQLFPLFMMVRPKHEADADDSEPSITGKAIVQAFCEGRAEPQFLGASGRQWESRGLRDLLQAGESVRRGLRPLWKRS